MALHLDTTAQQRTCEERPIDSASPNATSASVPISECTLSLTHHSSRDAQNLALRKLLRYVSLPRDRKAAPSLKLAFAGTRESVNLTLPLLTCLPTIRVALRVRPCCFHRTTSRRPMKGFLCGNRASPPTLACEFQIRCKSDGPGLLGFGRHERGVIRLNKLERLARERGETGWCRPTQRCGRSWTATSPNKEKIVNTIARPVTDKVQRHEKSGVQSEPCSTSKT